MIVKTILPVGWLTTLEEAPPGPFIPLKYPDLLCFKSEYRTHLSDYKDVEAYNCAGEYYHGEGLVQPVEMVVTEEEQ